VTIFLSDEWFDEMAAAAAAVQPPADVELKIEQEIIDGESWTVRISAGTAEFQRGGSDEADFRVITDAQTAEGIRNGTVSAQRAFLDGRLRIGGDITALIEHRDVLAGLALGAL
jgi:opacity protein-like surface antigen